MKLLLYCTKSKPYLNDYRLMEGCNQFVVMNKPYNSLNGKVVAECDFEIDDLYYYSYSYPFEDCGKYVTTHHNWNLDNSCLSDEEIWNYLTNNQKDQNKNYGYAIHIKNLHIFDKPKELDKFEKIIGKVHKAPQNMMKVYEITYNLMDYILISIRPEWLCKILNGEKTIEVRKKVLKEMLE